MPGEVSIITASQGLTETQAKDLTNIFMERVSLLGFIPAESHDKGFTYTDFEMVSRTGGAKSRAFNQSIQATEEKIRERKYGLSIYEEKAKVDFATEKRSPGALYKQVKLKSNYLIKDLDDEIINGNPDADATKMPGLKYLCGPAIAGNRSVINAGAGSADINVTTQAGLETLLSALDAALREVANGANALIMSQSLIDGIRAGSRKYNFNVLGADVSIFNASVPTYQGVPLIPVGENAASVPILGFNESDTGGTAGTSIYAGRFNVDDGTRFWTDSGFEFNSFDDIDFMYEKISWTAGLVSPTRSLVRICRLKTS
jgi:hypothetical protein